MRHELEDGLYEVIAFVEEGYWAKGSFILFDYEVFYVGQYDLWIQFFVPVGKVSKVTKDLIIDGGRYCDFLKINFYPLNLQLPSS